MERDQWQLTSAWGSGDQCSRPTEEVSLGLWAWRPVLDRKSSSDMSRQTQGGER